MEKTERPLEEIILKKALRMNAVVTGLVTGLIGGFGIFLATNFLLLKGGEVVGPHLSLLSQYFIGYRVTFLGSLVGFAYAFGLGFVAGYGVARTYNWILDMRDGGTVE